MDTFELPLLELFTKLREAGLPLGIDEYRLLLRALQAGFGTADREALSFLCKKLWVKSLEEEHLFDHHFQQIVPEVIDVQPDSVEPAQPTSPQRSSRPAPEPKSTPARLQIQEDATKPDLDLSLELDDEIQVVQAVRKTTTIDDEIMSQRLLLSSDYLPVTRRQMKQSWRYLRRPVREGPKVEFDVDATVEQIGRRGMLLTPVMIPRRVNRSELLLLFDQDGSMVPFHTMSHRLAETAVRGGRLGRTGIYYFHNCPMSHLYRDPHHQQARTIEAVLQQCRPRRTSVLIFSDAGAARGGYNPTRVEQTREFLERIEQAVRYIAWLNPMPRARWRSTTAGEIAQLVPMFETTRRGLDDALEVLRGRLRL